MHPRYQRFRQTTGLVWTLLAWLTTLLTAARLAALVSLADTAQLDGHADEVLRGLIVGLRFDLKVVAIGLAPVLLAGLTTLWSARAFGALRSAAPAYAGALAFLVTLVSIANYYYYETYGNHFDVFVFALAEDQTSAVLESIWGDYPVARGLLASGAIGCGVLWLARRAVRAAAERRYTSLRPAGVTAAAAFALLPYAVLARGSVGTFPLKRYHAQVSDYDLINKLTPNGFTALEWARSDKADESRFAPIDGQELIELAERFGQEGVWQRTAENAYLERRPPHVVVALMEAMGTNVLVEDAPPGNDLLGALRPHLERDFVFQRFVAGTNATIDTLAAMLLNSSVPTISHTSAQKTILAGSAARTYREAGYHTVFITAGNGMWRNLANYLPAQGFDEVLDQNSIERAFPAAARGAATWGVPDEYAFDLARKVLDEATRPTFVFVLTVTNHTPYRPPTGYRPRPVEVSERLRRLYDEEAQARAMLTTYQYAADGLGEFIAGVKASALGATTVVAATGDHRVRRLGAGEGSERAIDHAVPFYLYVPEPILAASPHRYDPTRVGSHKDVFPTLYAYSLSGARYVSLAGRNLLAERDVDGARFGYHGLVLLTPLGVIRSDHPERLYRWLPNDLLHVASEPVPSDDPTLHRDYGRWQSLYINSEVAGLLP